ncbi:MAG: PfaD family polyunsaturated fatty acid/polyketide biosynthesis protein [Myxococcota bacterium]|nr:PfaD family polyunsaturated fatty acid/polyketide biosynthesis protein [Myxococcota bacterium]
MSNPNHHSFGFWSHSEAPYFSPSRLRDIPTGFREPMHIVQDVQTGAIGVGIGGQRSTAGYPLLATLPPIYPEWLGDRGFAHRHGVRFNYVAGAMANGIASERLVMEMARNGFLSFFGAAGLSVERVKSALNELERSLPEQSWGANLIHSPNEPDLESEIAALYIQRGVRRVSAAAYMKLTPYVVRYALHGLHRDSSGAIQRKNHLFAKISRPEVAIHFMRPAPQKMVQELLRKGWITDEEARLAALVPVAEQFSIEADSGGHTDNQSLSALFPTISALRTQVMQEHAYERPIYLGAGGGLGTPEAIAGAFAMGASYVLTGSVNQACVESGLHQKGKEMLAKAGLADVEMAPAADMFELGVEVQVLKRGTMFASRAKFLYRLYRQYKSLADISDTERMRLEKEFFHQALDEAWRSTEAYWQSRDPREVARANRDPKHQMALLFRSYLGQSSKWAINGVHSRLMDYQIWCGPAMGAFNRWVKGSFLEAPSQRQVVQVAKNLMEGAAVIARAQQLRSFGVALPSEAFSYEPRPLS